MGGRESLGAGHEAHEAGCFVTKRDAVAHVSKPRHLRALDGEPPCQQGYESAVVMVAVF